MINTMTLTLLTVHTIDGDKASYRPAFLNHFEQKEKQCPTPAVPATPIYMQYFSEGNFDFVSPSV